MNAQLQAYLEQAKGYARQALQHIEESSIWERVLNRIENLDPTQKRQLRVLALVIAALVPAVIITVPLTWVIREKSRQASVRDLVDEMKEFNEERAVEKRPAPPPPGFQNLPIGNAAEALESVTGFMGQIGITPEISEVKASGNFIEANVKELSVKQLVALTYQMDAWFPAFVTESLRVEVNPDDRTLLTLQARYRYVAENAGSVGQGSARPLNTSYEEEFDAPTPPPPEPVAPSAPPSTNSRTSDMGTLPGSDYGDSFDDFAPPPDFAAPDDFGDLPPPPTFEEDL